MFILNSRSIYSNCDVPNQALGKIILVQRHDRDHWVVSVFSAFGKLHVHIIVGAVDLSMRGVRLHCHNLLFQLFFEVQLSGADGVFENKGPILASSPVDVDLNVNMNCSLNIEAC